MEFYKIITTLNVLSSTDTTKEKREEYKKCINALIKEHEITQKIIKKAYPNLYYKAYEEGWINKEEYELIKEESKNV